MATRKIPDLETRCCPECFRQPVVVKSKRGPWRVGCPYLDCIDISSYGETAEEAIKKWNDGEVVIG